MSYLLGFIGSIISINLYRVISDPATTAFISFILGSLFMAINLLRKK